MVRLITLIAFCLFTAFVNAEDDVETFVIESEPSKVVCDCKCAACPVVQCPATNCPAPSNDPIVSVLQNGEKLFVGKCLTSPNRIYKACVESSAHLVIRKSGGEEIWRSTPESALSAGAALDLQMQSDNNLCLHGGNWCAYSHGQGIGVVRAELRDDGNLVVVGLDRPIWSSKTGLNTLPNGRQLGVNQCLKSLDGRYRACLQTDANFCVFQDSKALWCSNTKSWPTSNSYRILMQGDNNLCTYDNVWCLFSHGRGTALASLNLQNDGNLVMIGGKVIWTWMTGFA